MIAALGLWLVWRGVRGLQRQGHTPAYVGQGHDHTPAHGEHGHDHTHAHGGHDHDHSSHVHGPQCDHAHGPTLEEVENISGWRDGVALVVGIAMRPCSGALFVLILTWQLGIAAAGIIGAFVMGLGTGLVTVTVALMAVWAREGVFASLGGGRVARAVPVLELLAGGVIALAALGLFWQAL
jgi:nickel/cobalt transporter (NicO) family protein